MRLVFRLILCNVARCKVHTHKAALFCNIGAVFHNACLAYEDFADYMTYEQFVALGIANFKVSVGKGYMTYDDILYLISIHLA